MVESVSEPAGRSKAAAATRASWFRREAISLAELTVHTFAVVLGILLALAIDEHKKERETAAGVAAAMAALHGELEGNRARLHHHQGHMLGMRDALLADTKEGTRTCDGYSGWSGTQTPLLLDAAYQTAIATQAFSHMEFSRVQSVAAAYGMQRLTAAYLDKILDVVLRGQEVSAATCGNLVAEVASAEGLVDGLYEKALEATAPARL